MSSQQLHPGVRDGVILRVGECRPFHQILILFRPKNIIFYTRSQTRFLKSKPFFRPGLKVEIMSSFLRLERKQKIFQMHSELAYFYFFVLIHLELERQIRLYTSVVPSKIIPVFRPNRNKKAKRLTSAAAQTHMAYIGKYPFPPPPPSWAIVLQK